MARIKGLKLDSSNYSVKQEIDLEDLTGLDLSDEDALKNEIGQAIIDRIIARTEAGESAYGGSLGKYSKSYEDSLDFKAFGKSNPVDLKLTGDMLGAIDILEDRGSKLTIGLVGDLQNAKAYGHQTGMKGNPELEGKVRPRPWFGVGYDDIRNEILPQFQDELRRVRRGQEQSQRAADLAAAEQALRDFILQQNLVDDNGEG